MKFRVVFTASHTIPMKRELKAICRMPERPCGCRFTHHPDEEGTESSDRSVATVQNNVLHTPSR